MYRKIDNPQEISERTLGDIYPDEIVFFEVLRKENGCEHFGKILYVGDNYGELLDLQTKLTKENKGRYWVEKGTNLWIRI